MIYLDYSATTPPNTEVLNTFIEVSKNFLGNPNSLHKLGLDAKNLIDASTKQIANILGVKEKEIIYTSGATESNNAAIFGVIENYEMRGKEIITTKLEHSSIIEPLKFLEKKGYIIKYVQLDKYGRVDLEDLKNKISNNTILVTISSINSEVGIKQDLNQIGQLLKKYPKIIFHSDITQSVGKEKLDLTLVDLASLSAQKFYGLKGSGILIKKENIELAPFIKGGKSTTKYRSGTPSPALIASTSKALRLAYESLLAKEEKIKELNTFLIKELSKIKEIHINSNKYSIPNIINISILNIKPETMLHALEENEIYISTKTACSSNSYSEAVYTITGNKDLSNTSLRISISYLTTKEELTEFLNVLKEKIKILTLNSK